MDILNKILDIQNMIGNAIDNEQVTARDLNKWWAEMNIIVSHLIKIENPEEE